MNKEAKQAHADKMSAQLSEWGAMIDVLKARVAKGTANVRIDYHNLIERWQKNEPFLKQKVDELRAAGADGFESVKSGAQSVWNEMSALISSVESEFEVKAVKTESKKE